VYQETNEAHGKEFETCSLGEGERESSAGDGEKILGTSYYLKLSMFGAVR